MRLRRFLKYIFRLLYKLFANVNVIDMENVPKEGGGILAPNHLGILDAPLIFVLVNRDDITALVAKKHQKNPFLRWVVNGAGGIWINRDEADSQAVRTATNHMRNGGLLGIAPEGTRSKTGALIAGKTGVAYLADKANVPVIPVAITGTQRGLLKLLRFRRPHIIVRFGKPFMLMPLDRTNRDQSLKRNTDEIMCRIANMLPPTYRGVYADHPCVQEMEREKVI
jgi:1-acyl-sn-glycerol-3-phosphate acyltransferase